MDNKDKIWTLEHIMKYHHSTKFSADMLAYNHYKEHDQSIDTHIFGRYLEYLSANDVIIALDLWNADGWMIYRMAE